MIDFEMGKADSQMLYIAHFSRLSLQFHCLWAILQWTWLLSISNSSYMLGNYGMLLMARLSIIRILLSAKLIYKFRTFPIKSQVKLWTKSLQNSSERENTEQSWNLKQRENNGGWGDSLTTKIQYKAGATQNVLLDAEHKFGQFD